LPEDREEISRSVDPEIISRELGESARPAALWLHQYQIHCTIRRRSVGGWQKLVDQELKRLETRGDETSTLVVSELLWNLADVHRRLGDTTKLLVVVDRMMNLGSDDSDDVLVNTLQWFVDHQNVGGARPVCEKYDGRIQQAKRPLYLVAMASC